MNKKSHSRRTPYFDRVPKTGAEEARYSRWLMAPAWTTRRRTKYRPHRREWLEGLAPRQVAGIMLVILCAAVLLVAFCAPGHADGVKGETPEASRRAKCAYLWQHMAPWSYRPDLCEFFVGEHERKQIGPEWASSFCYGFANFGLTLRKRAPGLCFGPMDVKWPGYARQAGCDEPSDLLDPWRNIRAHVLEARVGVGKGYSGVGLCRYVMLPAAPTDWGGGRFRRTWATMQSHLADYYCERDKEAKP